MRQIIVMMLFFTTISHAQIMGDVEADNDNRKLTSAQMENAIMLYDKMTASANYIEWQELTKKIYSIANKESNANSFIYNEENRNEKKIKEWVSKNVPLTYQAEAIKVLLRIVFLDNKISSENSAIIHILKYEASFSQWQEIEKPTLRRK